MITENPYLILGVNENADNAAVRQAYQQKLKKFPPEQNSPEFQQITYAYELLRDEVSRARLRLFGRGLDINTPFTALLPQRNHRHRIPFNDWVEDISTLNS